MCSTESLDKKGRQEKMDDEKAFYSERDMDHWEYHYQDERVSAMQRALPLIEDAPAIPLKEQVDGERR